MELNKVACELSCSQKQCVSWPFIKQTNFCFRTKAVSDLAKINYLDSWHFALIANMIDPRTAVALARSPNADRRFFLEPPFRYHNYQKDELINAMREFLIEVFEKSQHPCMGYFLSKAFVYDHVRY